MSKSGLIYVRVGYSESREEKFCIFLFAVCMVAMIAILHAATSWQIVRVIFAGFLISCIIIAAVASLVIGNREYRFHKKCMKIRSERTFYNFVLKGEIEEFPIEGTDLVEIRNIVAKI